MEKIQNLVPAVSSVNVTGILLLLLWEGANGQFFKVHSDPEPCLKLYFFCFCVNLFHYSTVIFVKKT